MHTRMPRGGFLPRGKARCEVATCARPRRGASPLCTHACRGVASPPVVWHAVRVRRVRGLGGGRARCELTHAAGWFLPPLYGALRGCDGSILPVVGLAQGLRASCPDKVRWHRLPNRAEAGRGCFRANEWMRGSARTARSHSVVCGGRRAHHEKRACSLRGRFIPLYFYTGVSFSISSSHSSKFIHSIANVPLEIQQDPQRARGHGRVRVRCAHAHAAGWFFPPCGAI